jgi:predicted kinase
VREEQGEGAGRGPRLYLLVGVPGSGKSTYARTELADKWRVCLDDLRFMLSRDPYAPSLQPVALALEEAALRALLGGVDGRRQDVVVDATNITRSRRQRYLRLAASFDVPVVAVFVQCDLQVAMARNRARPQPVPDEVVERMYRSLQPPDLSEGFEDVIYVFT